MKYKPKWEEMYEDEHGNFTCTEWEQEAAESMRAVKEECERFNAETKAMIERDNAYWDKQYDRVDAEDERERKAFILGAVIFVICVIILWVWY